MLLKECEVWKGVYCFTICGFDRQQAIERFKEEFKGDVDINKVKITRIQSSAHENNLGDKTYTIFFRLEDTISNKPNCIECGSPNIISKGVMWLCKDCGRWFTKKIRGPQPLNNTKK